MTTAVSIRRVPRRTRWLPHWAWYITTADSGHVDRSSGYARTWWGAALHVGRLIREEADQR
jgi:hypothetical protein